jgi:dipeptidyl aminopeptidase/acylaminoacyl peptidase
MKHTRAVLLMVVLLSGCGGFASKTPQTAPLADARKGFTTKANSAPRGTPAPTPPPSIFQKVQYEAAPGKLVAYLTPKPKDGKKHPAIIWITGGDCNSIDDGPWKEYHPSNDQSASAFRKEGIVMMFPSLRGGNDNPGVKEGFFGEIDDVIAAADYLAKQDYVDPKRIYLGGHSTGGTVVLLTAEYTDRFRAVFSFGPVDDVSGYDREYLPFNTSNAKEIELRSPGLWLASVHTPVFVFEGTSNGNLSALQKMSRDSTNPQLHFIPVKGATHFTVLAPVTKLLAQKILLDEGASSNINCTEDEMNRLFQK